jgi:hypothetical protein
MKGKKGFQKGQSGNPKGKPAGIKNSKTLQWEMFCEYCMNGGLKRYQEELDKLEGEKFVNAFHNLLEFHQPKLARTEIEQTNIGENIIRVIYDDEETINANDQDSQTPCGTTPDIEGGQTI